MCWSRQANKKNQVFAFVFFFFFLVLRLDLMLDVHVHTKTIPYVQVLFSSITINTSTQKNLEFSTRVGTIAHR